MKKQYLSYLELCKTRVALLAALSSATGFLLAASSLKSQVFGTALGVFLLSCGSLAVNQYQERALDAAMPRTLGRPIPTGRIKPVRALLFSGLLLLPGFAVLFLMAGLPACALALFTLAWYNGVYTYLKKISAFAAVPGALTGAMPPAIGWVAGGGALADPRLLVICTFFFFWQVPHSWLLIMQYGREYVDAGLPSLTERFSPPQLQRLIFNWTFATILSGLFLSALGLVHYPLTNIALLSLSLWLMGTGAKFLLLHSANAVPIGIFQKTNLYLLAVMALLSADKLLLLLHNDFHH